MALGKLVLNCFPLASKPGDASVVEPVLSSQEPPIGPFVSDKLPELLWHHRPNNVNLSGFRHPGGVKPVFLDSGISSWQVYEAAGRSMYLESSAEDESAAKLGDHL